MVDNHKLSTKKKNNNTRVAGSNSRHPSISGRPSDSNEQFSTDQNVDQNNDKKAGFYFFLIN